MMGYMVAIYDRLYRIVSITSLFTSGLYTCMFDCSPERDDKCHPPLVTECMPAFYEHGDI